MGLPNPCSTAILLDGLLAALIVNLLALLLVVSGLFSLPVLLTPLNAFARRRPRNAIIVVSGSMLMSLVAVFAFTTWFLSVLSFSLWDMNASSGLPQDEHRTMVRREAERELWIRNSLLWVEDGTCYLGRKLACEVVDHMMHGPTGPIGPGPGLAVGVLSAALTGGFGLGWLRLRRGPAPPNNSLKLTGPAAA
jgi:hypothetical protein